ncbi:PHB depolymerase family esterase [Neisseria montereyensis]|uniref:Alpha/beta hydrolase-fold protein n=1 Tax=Neisseria montereyensis TaxID=2973938 RepID=A0ABT2FER8_9NEIS|nr:PHB depolymerase family esterase [Neisseria montereyensis]MCS4534018.1 alpha/beta hydrolase-fold protein [Neisseria montereyensis]
MKKITTALTALGCAVALSGCQTLFPAQNQVDNTIADPVDSITAVTEVSGDGQKITAAVLHYDAPVLNDSLSPEDFAVNRRTITQVYSNDRPAKDGQGKDGNYVVVELSDNDEDAVAFGVDGRDIIRRRPELKVTQTGDISDVSGQVIAPSSIERQSTQTVNLVVDGFKQAEFTDPQTGTAVAYNLFVPEDYRVDKQYPLVLFLHDAAVSGADVQNTLQQGLGAVVWASPESQAKQEVLVLAPQFDYSAAQPYAGKSEADAVIRLIQSLQAQYNVDPTRIYVTGQGEGGDMAIMMNAGYPDLFAASYIVAAPWNGTQVVPPVQGKMWIVAAEGDEKAFAGMNKATDAWAKQGARVVRDMWSGLASPEEFDRASEAMRNQQADVYYTVLQKGTVVPSGKTESSRANQRNTWRIAYTIDSIRDWLLAQHK